jgi:hypothetical protein
MKALLDAFLELPTWQGVTLLAAVVFAATYFGWRMFWVGYRHGRRDENRGKILIATNPRVWRSHPASRISDHESRTP